MPAQLLSRRSEQARPVQVLHPDVSLPLARMHEVCGAARRTFAALLARQMQGPVLWIIPAWESDQLNPEGLLPFFDPSRLIFVAPKRIEDLLWCAEETLRSGTVPLVVADLPGPPGLTAVRRMHLAAENGAQLTGHAPLGLLLTPGDGGAPGVETRWHMEPAYHGRERRWHLQRRRARSLPPKAWSAVQTHTHAGLNLIPAPDPG